MARQPLRDLGALAGALVLHLSVVGWAARTPPPAPQINSNETWIELEELVEEKVPEEEPKVLPPEPEPAEPEDVPPPSVTPPPPVPVVRETPTTPPSTELPAGEPTDQEPEPPEAAPLLTDDGGSADWMMASGFGTALSGGVSRRGSGSGLNGTARASHLAPRDFSRPPMPPNLQPIVRKNYPDAAKMYGHQGTVTVRALIRADGTPSAIRVESVDPGGKGFGEACIRSLQHGPQWKPGLNRNGHPIDAEAAYTCSFNL